MTNHLSSQDFVNALDRELAPARQAHLDGCPSCQAQVEELRALVHGAEQGAAVPEPSPLFWDHFQARVMEAARAEPAATRPAWWSGARVWLTMSAAVIATVASAAFYLSSRVPSAPDAVPQTAEMVESEVVPDSYAALDTDEWEFVTSVMGTLESDDIHEVLTPSRHAVDTAFEALTATERETFMKLLKAEMGQGTVQ